MTIRSREELDGMRRVGRVVAATREAMRDAVRPGVSTAQLDAIGERVARAHGARSAPQLTYRFPGFTCISVNDAIVHGIPGDVVVRAGDLVTLDVTLELDGFMADSAMTVAVPPAAPTAQRLVRAARRAFDAGCRAARAGVALREVGRAVERSARRDGTAVFRTLCGHGIGRRLHEEPTVPNWADPDADTVLHDGLVLALEPMLGARGARVVEDRDGWTLRSHDGTWSAHHEHTLVVRDGAPLLLTV